MFTDWTGSIFEESKLTPLEWLLVMGLWQLKLNATEIAAAADIQERTAQRCINLLDGGIYETYHLDPTRQLEHQVEADECYQSAGSKGLAREVERHERAPRPRGIQLRRRATAETGRPPILGLVQRRAKTDQDAPAAQVYLEVLENVRTATIKPIIAAKVKVGHSSLPMHTTSTISPRSTRTIGRSTMGRASTLGVTRMGHVCTVTRWKAYGLACAISWTTARVLANASCTCARTLRVPPQPWALALASDLRSSLAVHFLDHRRLLAVDGSSTSPYASNALLPMSARD
jgi:hypothetical protein